MALISTIQASCRDCYKCVRSCPVKAIKVTAGHAEVVEGRCIGDGRCIKVCPQQAKKIESSIRLVQEMIHSGLTVAVSIAPSFIGILDGVALGQMVTAIKKLGFRYVAETAEGAEGVALEHRRLMTAGPAPVITSCCPVIVNLIAAVLTVLVGSALVNQEQANAVNTLALAIAGIVPIFAGAFAAGRYINGRAAVKSAEIELLGGVSGLPKE